MLKLSYDAYLTQISVADDNIDDDDETFPTEELGRLLADLIRKIGPPRPMQVMAVAVDTLRDLLNPSGHALPGVDPAEEAFARAADDVVQAWQRHDDGVSQKDVMDVIGGAVRLSVLRLDPPITVRNGESVTISFTHGISTT